MESRSRVVPKVWVDLDNSPHVLFFNPIIKELNKRGYQVVVTVRDYAQVCSLADLFKLGYRRIGRHYGKSKFLKVVGLLVRTLQMVPFLIVEKPDLAFSHGSRSQLMAAKIFGIPTLMADDYEHSKQLPFIHPTRVIMPEVIPEHAIKGKRISRYPGIKENVYVHDFEPDPSILKSLGIDDGSVIVIIRPPATMAHYHDAESEKLFGVIMEYLCSAQHTRLVLLPRTEKQSELIRKKWQRYVSSNKITLPDRTFNGLNLIWHSDLVLSGGGTMIREAAALGVPAYSFFSGRLGAVDQHLVNTGRLTLLKATDDVRSRIILTHRNNSAKSKHKICNEALHRIIEELEVMLKEDRT